MQHTPLEFHPCDGLTVRLQRSNDNLDSASTAARGLDIGFRAKLACCERRVLGCCPQWQDSSLSGGTVPYRRRESIQRYA